MGFFYGIEDKKNETKTHSDQQHEEVADKERII